MDQSQRQTVRKKMGHPPISKSDKADIKKRQSSTTPHI
jgi:hypothetical protein